MTPTTKQGQDQAGGFLFGGVLYPPGGLEGAVGCIPPDTEMSLQEQVAATRNRYMQKPPEDLSSMVADSD